MKNYIFIPKISVTPTRVAVYNEVSWFGKKTNLEKIQIAIDEAKISCSGDDLGKAVAKIFERLPKKTVTREFHNFQISPKAQKNLRDKIQWLYHLSKSRYIKTYSGKELFNFKMNFITLTLPSRQVHPTSQITSECFNQFLTEVKKRTGMDNFVWRLEFQANKNVHYHLVSDTYLDYFFIQKIWNRIINKLGYVDRFTQRMDKMSLNDYFIKYFDALPEKFDIAKKRYFKGRSEKWKKPPSVDVKNCSNDSAISGYIAKYFTKPGHTQNECNPLDYEGNSFGLRLWFCSRSLSKLKSVVSFLEVTDFRADCLLDGAENVRVFLAKYAKMYYFNIKKLSNYIKSELYQYLRNYATLQKYVSAGTTSSALGTT